VAGKVDCGESHALGRLMRRYEDLNRAARFWERAYGSDLGREPATRGGSRAAELVPRRWPAANGVSRRPLLNHLRAGQPYGPRRCGGPEHSAGYLTSLRRIRITIRTAASTAFLQRASFAPLDKSRPARLVNPSKRQNATGFLTACLIFRETQSRVHSSPIDLIFLDQPNRDH
jgi:hypothetical protein